MRRLLDVEGVHRHRGGHHRDDSCSGLPARSRGGAHVGDEETLEGGLCIDRTWWAAVKVGAIVAASVLLALAIVFAFL